MSDSLGAALPGVTVEATSPSLQGSRAVTTSADGRFWLPALPPGVYGVRAVLSGFRSTRKSAVVSLDTTATVSFALEPAVEEAVAVSGPASPIDLTSTTGGTKYPAL